MRSKLQNACLYKTALIPRLLRVQTSKAVAYATMRNGVFFLYRFSIKSQDYSTKLRILKTNYIGQGWWCGKHSVDDILDKMKGLQEPTVWYHDLQTSTGGSCMCNQARQEKSTFQRLEIFKHDSAQQWLKKGSALQQSDSSKQPQRENSQICPSPPATSKRWSPAPAL